MHAINVKDQRAMANTRQELIGVTQLFDALIGVARDPTLPRLVQSGAKSEHAFLYQCALWWVEILDFVRSGVCRWSIGIATEAVSMVMSLAD